jgi:hypothetical protein
MVVYRWNIEAGEFSLDMPEGARILPTIKRTSGGTRIYAVCDPDAPTETRHFVGVANKEPLPVEDPDALNYIGTHKVCGAETLHVFEVVSAPVA